MTARRSMIRRIICAAALCGSDGMLSARSGGMAARDWAFLRHLSGVRIARSCFLLRLGIKGGEDSFGGESFIGSFAPLRAPLADRCRDAWRCGWP